MPSWSFWARSCHLLPLLLVVVESAGHQWHSSATNTTSSMCVTRVTFVRAASDISCGAYCSLSASFWRIWYTSTSLFSLILLFSILQHMTVCDGDKPVLCSWMLTSQLHNYFSLLIYNLQQFSRQQFRPQQFTTTLPMIPNKLTNLRDHLAN